jgi:hypothetical protein
MPMTVTPPMHSLQHYFSWSPSFAVAIAHLARLLLLLLTSHACCCYCSPRTLAVAIAHLAHLLPPLVFGSAGSGPSRWTIAMGLAGGDCKLSARQCCRLEWGCPFRLSATPTIECRTPSISLLRRTRRMRRERSKANEQGLVHCNM